MAAFNELTDSLQPQIAADMQSARDRLLLNLDEDVVRLLRTRQETDFMLRDYRGQDTEMVPVHPLVAARLGLAWYEPDRTYRWHGHEWTFREYTLKYIRWEPFLA